MSAARVQVNPQNDGERLTALEQALCNVETQVEKIDKKIDEKFEELGGQLSVFIQSADLKYASKLTERIVYALVGLTLVAVFGALVALVVH